MNCRLEGRCALVTGSARRGSIGRAIVRSIAGAGASVAINDFNRDEEAEEFVGDLTKEGFRAVIVSGDVTRPEVCERIVENVVAAFGKLDILVNNAGFANHQLIGDISEVDWDYAVDLHLKAPFFLARAAATRMVQNGFGRIVNISSEQAYIGHPELPHYSAAKAGLRTLSKSLALAYAPNVTVNTVCPGPTATEKFKLGPEFARGIPSSIPLGRWGTPEDVAESVLFLLTSGGDAYTGQTLDPNVGVVMD